MSKKETETSELVSALVEAIKLTKPVEKKTAVTRTPGDPWSPKDGTKKHKLRRKMYQHNILIDPDLIDNQTIDLLNKIKTGRFMDGWVRIYKRKDAGVDIDYPIKTASQRMKLSSTFGIRSLNELLERCIDEAKNPRPEIMEDDD